MWIDKATFLPVRYVAMRTVAAPTDYYTYLVTVNAIKIAGHLVNVDAAGENKYGRAAWRISDLSFPDSEPDWGLRPHSVGGAQWSDDSQFTAKLTGADATLAENANLGVTTCFKDHVLSVGRNRNLMIRGGK